MTDQEMLALAAKAAGAEHNGYRFGENGREPLYGVFVYDPAEDCEVAKSWNSRNNNEDAFSLAARLTMEIDHNHPADQTLWVSVRAHPMRDYCVEEFDDEGLREDRMRLAITRAAAEIGRAMP